MSASAEGRPDHGPLPALAVTAVAGAHLGRLVQPGVPAWLAVAAVGLAVLGRSALGRGAARRRPPAAAVGLLLVVAALAGLRVALVERGPLWQLAVRGGPAPCVMTVVGEPRRAAEGWWLLVRVDRMGVWRTREGALVRWPGDRPPPVVGSRWRERITARPLDEHGFGGWLRTRHTAVEVTAPAWRRVGPPGPGLRVVEGVRRRIRAAAVRHLPPEAAGLAVGLVTGDTRLLPRDLAEAMRATGLSHLTAVSGSNVAVVVAGVVGLAAAAGVGARGRRRLVLGALVGFAVLTRLEPSVLRATVMAGVVLLASGRGVPWDPVQGLAGAVLLLVLADPGLATTPGLLLSASAAAGVLVVAPRARARLGRLPRGIRSLVALTVGAQVAVAPVLLAGAGGVPLASVPANLVAVPAAALASAVAVVGASLAVVSVPAGAAVLWLAGPALSVVGGVAVGLRGVGGELGWHHPAALLLGAALVVWLLARRGSRGARVAGAATAAAALLLVLVPLVPRLVPRSVPRGLTVTAIDVGQGDAVLLQTPGAAVLVDAGPDATAAAWLTANGVRRLDLLVVSHGHEDHVGGVPEVLARIPVGALWHRPVGDGAAAGRHALAAAAARGTPVHRPLAGERAVVAGLLLEVLSPRPGRPYARTDSEANDSSLVLRASWGGRRVLLTGDVERAAQADLLRAPDRLRADVLKVPHHGAGTSDPRLPAAVGAATAVISVGVDNGYGHPHPETLDALRRSGADVRRTDEEGTVQVTLPAAAGRPSRGARGIAWPHVRPRHPADRRRRSPAATRPGGGSGRPPGAARRPDRGDPRGQ